MNNNIKHTKIYLSGNIAIKALGFISISFYTHYLSVNSFGLMSLYSTVLSFLTTLLGLGILGSFKRYYFEKDNDLGSFLFSNFILLTFSSLLFISIYFYYLRDISHFLNIPQAILKYAIFVAVLLLIIRIKIDFLQIREKSKQNVVFEFIQTSFSIVLSVIFILALSNDKYMGKLYADLIAFSFIALYSIYKLFNVIRFKFELKYVRYSLSFGLPVLPSMFASFGLAFADRLMINSMTNTSDVGLYSFGYTIAMLLQVIILSIGKSWQPLFYRSLQNKDYKTLDSVFLINSKIVFFFSLILILFSHETILLLATNEYEKSETIILYLIFGFNFFFLYTIYGQYTSYAKKTYWDSIITISSVLLNIVLNYYYLPKYGFIASSITTIISYFWMFTSFYVVSRFILKFEVVNINKITNIIGLYISIVLLFLYFNSQNIPYIFIFLIKIFLIIGFVYLIFKDKLLGYIRKGINEC